MLKEHPSKERVPVFEATVFLECHLAGGVGWVHSTAFYVFGQVQQFWQVGKSYDKSMCLVDSAV